MLVVIVVFDSMDTYRYTCGGHLTVWGSQLSPFTFVQVPGIELRPPRLYAKHLYPVSHPICLRYVADIEKSHRVMLFKKISCESGTHVPIIIAVVICNFFYHSLYILYLT